MASSAYPLLVRERLFDVSVYPLCGFYPSYEGFDQKYKDKWREGVSLDHASQDLEEACPSARGEKFCVCFEV